MSKLFSFRRFCRRGCFCVFRLPDAFSRKLQTKESVEEPIRNEWVEADREFIGKVNAVLKSDPANIEKVLPAQSYEDTTLGFGYRLRGGRLGKGYASYYYSYLYRNGKLVSYWVMPPIPDTQPTLGPLYQKMCSDVFPSGTNGTLTKYWYHREASEILLEGCPTKPAISEKMRFFMGPNSGTAYGVRGGFAATLLPNRRSYLEVKDEITQEICVTLLYSINPATRLTAYEHFLRHRKKFDTVADVVEKRMREVFAEKPKVTTLNGCIEGEEDSASLVERFARAKERDLQ